MTYNGSWLLRLLAFVLFLIAVVVVIAHGSFEYDAALIPAGLAAWVASTFVP